MPRHLRLGPHKGLKICELRSLGQINVVCGKNNSGKSTVLEAVNALNREIGIDANDLVETLTVPLREASGITEGRSSHYHETMLRLLSEHLNSQSVWFASDSQLFTDGLEQRVRQSPRTNTYRWNPTHVGKAFQRAFSVQPNLAAVHLPAKRQLDTRAVINARELVTTVGTGILNHLFLAKNQFTGPLRKFFDDIASGFRSISQGYDIVIESDQNNSVGLFFAKDGRALPADACGLGLQDVLVLLYHMTLDEPKLLAIEEPENHLHPEMQKRLLIAMRDHKEKQFIMTTHSNVFLNNAFVDRVYFTSIESGDVQATDATSRASILDDLGYSVTDNLVSDVIILVEGPTDIPILEELLIKMGVFQAYNIKLWPLGGDIMDQLDLSVLAQGYSAVALIDNDPNSERIRTSFVRNCDKHGIAVTRLERRAIENYFTLRALREVFGKQIPEDTTSIDGKTSLEEQIGLNVKKNNRRLARSMHLDELADSDLLRFLKGVESKCKETAIVVQPTPKFSA